MNCRAPLCPMLRVADREFCAMHCEIADFLWGVFAEAMQRAGAVAEGLRALHGTTLQADLRRPWHGDGRIGMIVDRNGNLVDGDKLVEEAFRDWKTCDASALAAPKSAAPTWRRCLNCNYSRARATFGNVCASCGFISHEDGHLERGVFVPQSGETSEPKP